MFNSNRLSSLSCGQEATVKAIRGANRVSMRLMEIGLVPGRSVTVLRRAPFGGPLQLLIDQTRVAVRTAEAECIEVAAACSVEPAAVSSVPSKAAAIA